MFLCDASLGAMRYIVSAPSNRLFSFTLPDDALMRLSLSSESYLSAQAGRRFSTLEYWKRIRSGTDAIKV